jgi:uncharacterized protein (DUF1499 family)
MNQADSRSDEEVGKTANENIPSHSILDHDEPSKKKPLKRTTSKRIVRRLTLIPLIMIGGLFYLSMTSPQPTGLGVTNGMLAKCPPTPNCVSTQATDPDHQMPVISFECPAGEMLEKIKQTVQSQFPRATLVSEFDHYLHFEFKSLIFRFVDDVEFFVDDKAAVVHFRSASRVGHSDLGANRKRMKQISESLNQ